MFCYNKTLVEFDPVQRQISFSGSSDVRLSFASPNITCPCNTNLMLDSVSSNKCLMYVIFSDFKSSKTEIHEKQETQNDTKFEISRNSYVPHTIFLRL